METKRRVLNRRAPGEKSTVVGCLVLVGCACGIIGLVWLWDLARNRLNPEKFKQDAAIRICSQALGEEYMPGFTGLNSARPIATVTKEAANLYMVRWPIGESTWCRVDIAIIDDRADGVIKETSWRAKR